MKFARNDFSQDRALRAASHPASEGFAYRGNEAIALLRFREILLKRFLAQRTRLNFFESSASERILSIGDPESSSGENYPPGFAGEASESGFKKMLTE